MTRDETLAAFRALPEEDQAAFMKAVMPEPEPEERAEGMDDLEERAEAPVAERSVVAQLLQQISDLNADVAELKKDKHTNARSAAIAKVMPAMRGAAGAVFDSEGVDGVEKHFAQYMVRTDVIGKDGQPKADSVPTDEAGLVAYVRSNLNEGESFVDGLARIRAAFPDKYRAAVTTGVNHG